VLDHAATDRETTGIILMLEVRPEVVAHTCFHQAIVEARIVKRSGIEAE